LQAVCTVRSLSGSQMRISIPIRGKIITWMFPSPEKGRFRRKCMAVEAAAATCRLMLAAAGERFQNHQALGGALSLVIGLAPPSGGHVAVLRVSFLAALRLHTLQRNLTKWNIVPSGFYWLLVLQASVSYTLLG
jgi:hypothetical protein